MEDMIEAQMMLPEALRDSLASSAPRLVEMLHAAARVSRWSSAVALEAMVRARWR